jgi:hypothetical protein
MSPDIGPGKAEAGVRLATAAKSCPAKSELAGRKPRRLIHSGRSPVRYLIACGSDHLRPAQENAMAHISECDTCGGSF